MGAFAVFWRFLNAPISSARQVVCCERDMPMIGGEEGRAFETAFKQPQPKTFPPGSTVRSATTITSTSPMHTKGQGLL